jgi:hypothetical protein
MDYAPVRELIEARVAGSAPTQLELPTPPGEARERDEQAIRYWQRVRQPRLGKKRSASDALPS